MGKLYKLKFLQMLKYLVNIVTGLGIVLLLFYFICCAVIWTTILNPGFGTWCLDKSFYAEKLAGDLETSFINLGQPSGIPAEVLKNTAVPAQLRRHLVGFVTGAANYLAGIDDEFTFQVDTTEFESRLTDKIYNYAIDQQILIDSRIQTGISNYVKECAQIYKNSIIINTSLLPRLRNAMRPFVKYPPIIAIFLAGLILIQISINRSFSKVLNLYSFHLTALGIITLSLAILCSVTGITDRLNLEPQFFKDLCAAFITGITLDLVLIGAACLLIGILLKAAYIQTRKKHRQHIKEMQQMWEG